MATQRENENDGVIPAFRQVQLRLATPRLLEPKNCLQIKTDRQKDADDWLEAAMKRILQRHGDCVQVASDQLGEDLWQCRGHSWNMGPCTPDQILAVWEKWTAAITQCGTDATAAREPYQHEWSLSFFKILEDYRQCCRNFPESCARDAGTPQE